ncbi:MAG TPA: hypothetical protein D7I06_03080 [Candidatus Poseidoniales archaeon]|nr:MAG TPA: hypothetical protein D7I06_03080 [Candidatus Poseidoniales archaeon]
MSRAIERKNGLILFMGERVEHAITSIQKYVPETVYIVTSDKFESKHKRRLIEWSKQYNFRAGGVKSISNLFEQSAITSLLNEVITIRSEEYNLHESDLNWFIGITGGTMHMAAAGSYAGILMGSKVFYVIQPPGDGRPMPNRDVIEFPQLLGLGTIMHQPIEIISLLRDGSGLIKDLAEIIPESLFWKFCEMDILFIDEDKWFVTEEGSTILDLVGNTAIANSLLEEKIKKIEEILEAVKSDNPDSFIGWA